MTSTVQQVVDICPYTIRQHAAQAIVLAFAAGTVGALAATYVARRRIDILLEEAYQQGSDDAEESMETFSTIVRKEGYFSTPEETAKRLIPEDERPSKEERAAENREPNDEPKLEEHNIFDISATELEKQMQQSEDEDSEVYDPDPEWDWAEELADRDTSGPYVIHLEEFLENEYEHNQLAITYFAGDEVLTDESDFPVMSVNDIVGLVNLERFGSGSGDANTVFVRNEKLQTDYEISRSSGKFGVEVAGFMDSPSEFEHAATRERMRRSRPSRDDL